MIICYIAYDIYGLLLLLTLPLYLVRVVIEYLSKATKVRLNTKCEFTSMTLLHH